MCGGCTWREIIYTHDVGRGKKDPSYQGHIVNTASMAGLLTAPNMGVYNVSKHAVVALTETLYQD